MVVPELLLFLLTPVMVIIKNYLQKKNITVSDKNFQEVSTKFTQIFLCYKVSGATNPTECKKLFGNNNIEIELFSHLYDCDNLTSFNTYENYSYIKQQQMISIVFKVLTNQDIGFGNFIGNERDMFFRHNLKIKLKEY